MTNQFAAGQGDLGEAMSALAQEAAMPAGDQGLAFFYDYRGPSFDASRYKGTLEAIVRPLLRRAVEGGRNRAIFFSVDVIEHPPDAATVVLQVAETGLAVSERSVRLLMGSTKGGKKPLRAQAARDEELESIHSHCLKLDGWFLVGEAPGEGRVARADLLLRAPGVHLDHTAALQHGAVAWLVGEPPVVFESLVRRLHRLGWTVYLFPSLSVAISVLQAKPAQRPDIVIGAERYNVSIPELEAFAETVAPATAVHATLLSSSPVQPDELGFVGNVQIFANPFSSGELYQLTVRTLAKLHKVLRLAVLPAKALARRPRALLVEDNPLNQLLSTELLRLFGFEVDIASNGQEAIEHFVRELPTVIIMDINMPVMDGLEAARRIRELERRGTSPYVPIVASTAQTDPETQRLATEAGMNGFVPKPIDIALMQSELARVLQVNSFELPQGKRRLAL
jgi:CheY-like chemotaxis protein